MEYFLYHECHFSLKEGDEVPMDMLARMYEVHAWSMFTPKEKDDKLTYQIVDDKI